MTSEPKPGASDREKPAVAHRPEIGRFEIVVDGGAAILDYTVADGRMNFVRTEVPAALEGRGLGSQLARAGLDYARREKLRVVPLCSFIRAYVDRHPEYAVLVGDDG